MYCLEIKGASV
uniref:Uncharacterized protein n=1 Tax=Arundo donax TaxID=35708 RepID=A0A0A9HPI1_ARUDO